VSFDFLTPRRRSAAVRSGATPSQTVGPFFSLGLSGLSRSELGELGAGHTRYEFSGRVLDGAGTPIPDAVLELWQADARGHYPHPEDPHGHTVARELRAFARVPTDAQGRFAFSTTKPGAVPADQGAQAPHINVQLFMRGLLLHACTRVYLPDEPALASDPVLALVPAERRGTLIARRDGERAFAWDVHMQGALETVFFAY
jgi:protocatechuate 3,4-dioxygenase alpha subunit